MATFITREFKEGKQVHDHPVLDRVYRSRGIVDQSQLQYELKDMLDPFLMKGMDQAAEIIAQAVEQNKRIKIIGDYDCDGATSTAIMVHGLNILGADQVSFLVPDRFKYGYGLTPAIAELAEKDKPELIITVDNGIASIDGVKSVKSYEHGCQIVVTDHHLAGDEIPEADAIVNPNQPGCDFPSKAMAGCGVAFYTIIATRKELKDRGYFDNKDFPNLMPLIDLVALGTVADVVALDYNNRLLVSQGLKYINDGYARHGIEALLSVGGKKTGNVISSDFGFVCGPRLNSAGRLDNMSIGIELLLEKDSVEAAKAAHKLDNLNNKRKEIENEMRTDALIEIGSYDNEIITDWAISLYNENWHEGVIGIVASRIKDDTHRPVICFAKDEEGNLKGSGRSVQGFHLRDALDNVSKKHPDIILKFGGHSMAAGLTIAGDKLTEFKSAFNDEAKAILTEEQINGIIETDGELETKYINRDMAQLIKDSGPWGQHFPEPVFFGEFKVMKTQVLKEKHIKFTLKARGSQSSFQGICFNAIKDGKEPSLDMIRAAYTLDINEFKGNRNLQLMIQNFDEIKDKPKLKKKTGIEKINKPKRLIF